MSTVDFFAKMTGYEAAEWVKLYAEHMGTYDKDTFEDTLMKVKPEGFKPPTKKRVSKHSTDPLERSNEEYDRTLCNARITIGTSGKRYGVQCSCKRIGDSEHGLCKRHHNEAVKNDGQLRCGFINQGRPTHYFNMTDNDKQIIFWHDAPQELLDRYPTKKKEKKPRKCSCCGQVGHTKAKCPNRPAANDTDSSNVSNVSNVSNEELLKILEARGVAIPGRAQEQEQEQEQEKVQVQEPEQVQGQEQEQEQVQEQEQEQEQDNGAGTGLIQGDDLETDDLETDEEDIEDESETKIAFEYQGIAYKRTPSGDVLDEYGDLVGTWDESEDSIQFNRFGLKTHRNALKALE